MYMLRLLRYQSISPMKYAWAVLTITRREDFSELVIVPVILHTDSRLAQAERALEQ